MYGTWDNLLSKSVAYGTGCKEEHSTGGSWNSAREKALDILEKQKYVYVNRKPQDDVSKSGYVCCNGDYAFVYQTKAAAAELEHWQKKLLCKF